MEESFSQQTVLKTSKCHFIILFFCFGFQWEAQSNLIELKGEREKLIILIYLVILAISE